MITNRYNSVNEASVGYSHQFKISYKDLIDTAGTTKTLDLLTLEAGDIVEKAAFWLPTTFDGGSTSALALDVGYDMATVTDDPDAFLDNYEIHEDASEVKAGDGNGAVFATLRTGFAAVEAGKVTALFTATGANLSTLTQGEVWVFLKVTKLAKLG